MEVQSGMASRRGTAGYHHGPRYLTLDTGGRGTTASQLGQPADALSVYVN